MKNAVAFTSSVRNRHINPNSFVSAYPNVRGKVIETSGPSEENILIAEQKGLADCRIYPFLSRAYDNPDFFKDIKYNPDRQPDTKNGVYWRPSVPVIPSQNNINQQPAVNMEGISNPWYYTEDMIHDDIKFGHTGIIPAKVKKDIYKQSSGYEKYISKSRKRVYTNDVENFIRNNQSDIPPLVIDEKTRVDYAKKHKRILDERQRRLQNLTGNEHVHKGFNPNYKQGQLI